MKVFNCPVCRITPEITATQIRCPKCGKTAKGDNLPDTVKNWDDGKYTTKTEVKPVVVEKPVDKSVEKPVKTEKTVKAPVKDAKTEKRPAQGTRRTRKN